MEKIKPTISAIVIAKNEEPRIARCLEKLSWTDEVIVIDNGSKDATIEIARKYNAVIVHAPGSDFSSLRTIGKEYAHGNWLLYIDADEEVPERLKEEIQKNIHQYKEGAPVGYFIKRDAYYLGKHWPYQDKMERLFLASSLVGWRGALHETPEVHGLVETLTQPLIHHTHRTLEEMLAKTNEWSNIEAHLRYKIRHPLVVWWRLLRVMTTGFIRSFVSQGGWRAGTVGWIESIYQAFSMFITYAKLWELQQKDRRS